MEAILNFINDTGFVLFLQAGGWKNLVMLCIACFLLYLGIGKKFEPLLMVTIAFGMLMTNLPGAGMFHEILFAGGHIHWDLMGGAPITQEFLNEMAALGVSESVLSSVTVGQSISTGLIDILYLGVKLGIYPCLIFMGVGAMTDFGPLIANPKSLLLGAAAQVGIFLTFAGCRLMGFTGAEAGSIGIIGGADGPTAIFVTAMLAPALLGPIAVAAYSYMALVPVIQPPIMKLLTTEKERQIVMKPLREVSKKEKIIFPIVVTIFVALLVPSAGPLIACLMLGNLFRECGVTERLSKTVQNELINIVTIFLGVSVGATATGATFLSFQTIKIMVMGIVAFGCGTAGGVLLAKFMNLFLKEKINPLIGSAGVSAVPMAARVSQKVGQEANPGNFLLMHAMGPNVAGVIGSAIAAGVLISLFG
ncbi:MAG: sodium ion-translocating decarboxylase subunit beta [Oscillospiraceae bacterium]|nr:sodium ion-translocating decarboxylase subunit beta [Oscillospiraceae bacterium]